MFDASPGLGANARYAAMRTPIGDRAASALGTTRGHIRTQFLAEAIALALLGGAAGIITGAAATLGPN